MIYCFSSKVLLCQHMPCSIVNCAIIQILPQLQILALYSCNKLVITHACLVPHSRYWHSSGVRPQGFINYCVNICRVARGKHMTFVITITQCKLHVMQPLSGLRERVQLARLPLYVHFPQKTTNCTPVWLRPHIHCYDIMCNGVCSQLVFLSTDSTLTVVAMKYTISDIMSSIIVLCLLTIVHNRWQGCPHILQKSAYHFHHTNVAKSVNYIDCVCTPVFRLHLDNKETQISLLTISLFLLPNPSSMRSKMGVVNNKIGTS